MKKNEKLKMVICFFASISILFGCNVEPKNNDGYEAWLDVSDKTNERYRYIKKQIKSIPENQQLPIELFEITLKVFEMEEKILLIGGGVTVEDFKIPKGNEKVNDLIEKEIFEGMKKDVEEKLDILSTKYPNQSDVKYFEEIIKFMISNKESGINLGYNEGESVYLFLYRMNFLVYDLLGLVDDKINEIQCLEKSTLEKDVFSNNLN